MIYALIILLAVLSYGLGKHRMHIKYSKYVDELETSLDFAKVTLRLKNNEIEKLKGGIIKL